MRLRSETGASFVSGLFTGLVKYPYPFSGYLFQLPDMCTIVIVIM